MRIIGHRANTPRWLHKQLPCSDGVEIDVVDGGGELRGGHVGPASSPLLLRERIGRMIEELRFTPSPPLGELLALVPPGRLVLLDMKDPVSPQQLARVVRAAGVPPETVYVSTRWHNLSSSLSSLGFRVLLSVDCRPYEPSRMVSSARAVGVAVRYSYLDREFVEEMRSSGFIVAAWTVNTREAFQRSASLGVDIVVTDAPCRLRRWLGNS